PVAVSTGANLPIQFFDPFSRRDISRLLACRVTGSTPLPGLSLPRANRAPPRHFPVFPVACRPSHDTLPHGQTRKVVWTVAASFPLPIPHVTPTACLHRPRSSHPRGRRLQ